MALASAIGGHMRGEIALEPALVVPMRAGWITRPPLLPTRIGRCNIDELALVPDPAQGKMRIEKDIRLREVFEPLLYVPQQQFASRPLDRDLGPHLAVALRRGVRGPGLVIDVVDAELDAMPDASALDDRHPGGVGLGMLAVEHVAHR